MFLRELTLAEKEDLRNIIYSSDIDTFQILFGIISIDLITADLISTDLITIGLTTTDLVSTDLITIGLTTTDLVSTDLIITDLASTDLANANLLSNTYKSGFLKQITYQELCSVIDGEDYPNYGPAALCGVIDTWIRLTMEYQGEGRISDLTIANIRGLSSSINAAVYGFVDAICHVGHGMSGKKQMELWKFYEQINEQMLKEKGLELYQLPELTLQYIVTCLDYLGLRRQNKPSNCIKVDVSGISYDEIY